MKVFYEATLKLSASKTPTAHLLFKQLLNIQALLANELKNPTDDPLHKVATSMKTIYQKYWGKWENINLFIYLAVVLDPRYKLRYLSFELNNIGVDKEMVKKLEMDVKELLHSMFKEYGAMMPRTNQSNENDENSDDDLMVEEDDSDIEDDDVVASVYHQSLRENQVVDLSDEVDR